MLLPNEQGMLSTWNLACRENRDTAVADLLVLIRYDDGSEGK